VNTLMDCFYSIFYFAKGFLFGIGIVLGLCSIVGLIIWWIPVSIIYDWNIYLFFGAWWGWWIFLWATWVGIANARRMGF